MAEADYNVLGKTPISAENPTGEDITYDPDFEWLQNEMVKLTKPVLADSKEGGNKDSEGSRFVYLPVDWPRVVETCNTILQSKSKDIRIATFLGKGLMETAGLDGMTKGLDVALQLITEFWDNMYPARIRTRTVAIEGLRDYVREFLDGGAGVGPHKLTKEDVPFLEKASSLIENINSNIKIRMADTPIPFGLLETTLDRKLTEARKLQGAAVPPPPPTPSPPVVDSQPNQVQPAINESQTPPLVVTPIPTPAQAPKAGYDFTTESDRIKYFNDLRSGAAELLSHGLKTAPHDPLWYHWIRVVYWGPVAYPPSTQFVPLTGPNEIQLNYLQSLADAGQWNDLLQTSEPQFPTKWFWLDLQRFTCEALENLGDNFQLARQTVIDELLNLVGRMPHFISLCTQDKIPVANEETQDWIKGLQSRSTEPATDSAAIASTPIVDTASSNPALKSFKPGKSVPKSLENAREVLQSCRFVRERFIVQLDLAGYLVSKKETGLAHSYLEQLDRHIATHGLEQWEPELAVKALCLMHACYLKMGKTRKDEKAHFTEKSRALLSRIAEIDPVAAATVAKDCS